MVLLAQVGGRRAREGDPAMNIFIHAANEYVFCNLIGPNLI